MSPESVYEVEAFLVAVLFLGWGLYVASGLLARARPGFSIWHALVAGAVLRVGASAVLGASGTAEQLRGDDEPFLIAQARALGETSPNNIFETAFDKLHMAIFAGEFRFGFDVAGVRAIQVLFTLLGVAFLAAAAYDLAGPRAARLTAWILAIEPASVFFGSAIHKEPFMYLAAGLVVLGCTRLWVGLGRGAPLLMASGCLLAIGVRPYAGWFLVGVCLLLMLHASLRHASRKPLPAVALLAAGLVAVGIGIGPALDATSGDTLDRLQRSQEANATDENSNLNLEPVDFSSRESAAQEIPGRVRDVLLKPYPWQVANSRQQIGVLGTLAAFATLVFFIRYALLSRGAILTRIAPVVYPLTGLLIAFSLSAGNAGTSFRYRTNLIALALVGLVVLRQRVVAQAGPRTPSRVQNGVLASASGGVDGGERRLPVVGPGLRSLPDT